MCRILWFDDLRTNGSQRPSRPDRAAGSGNEREGTAMYDVTMMRVVASDRRADAHQAADLHRQRVALRADARSVLASTLQRLAMRLDARSCQVTQDARTRDAIAARSELCSAV
jgi:hypothetical protein